MPECAFSRRFLLGLDDASDIGVSWTDGLTNLNTGFTITGRFDPPDPLLASLTVTINGSPHTVTANGPDGFWSVVYTGSALVNGLAAVDTSFTTLHESGEVHTRSAEQPYTCEIDSAIAAPVLDLDDPAGGTGHSATFAENGTAVAVAGAPAITDADDTMLQSAMIVLANPQADDLLSVNAAALPTAR